MFTHSCQATLTSILLTVETTKYLFEENMKPTSTVILLRCNQDLRPKRLT